MHRERAKILGHSTTLITTETKFSKLTFFPTFQAKHLTRFATVRTYVHFLRFSCLFSVTRC